MGNKFRKERYIFRIYCVSKFVVSNFIKEFGGIEYNITDLAKTPIRRILHRYTIKISLDKKQKFKKIASLVPSFIKRHNITRKSYGVWISLSTNRDMDGLTVPKYVVEFYKKVGGALDFSFTCLDDEPD